MDSIFIQDLELWTSIGITEEERANEQRLLMSIELFVDTRAAAKSDDIAKTIDYAAVASDVLSLATTPRATLERLAEDTAMMILKNHKPEGGVKISIQKFALPCAKSAHITIFRK